VKRVVVGLSRTKGYTRLIRHFLIKTVRNGQHSLLTFRNDRMDGGRRLCAEVPPSYLIIGEVGTGGEELTNSETGDGQ